MPVYLPTSIVANESTLLTLGHSGEIMGWFYPSKDHAQNISQCMPCVYFGPPHHGQLHWTWGEEWRRHQEYLGDSNVCVTTVINDSYGVEIAFTDLVPEGASLLLRRILIRNLTSHRVCFSVFHFGDWNMGGIRTGNALRHHADLPCLVQSHRDVAVAIGGSAFDSWQCGKAGKEWGNNARYDLEDGVLSRQDLEIGDVNWAFGFDVDLHGGATADRLAIFSMAPGADAAVAGLQFALTQNFEELLAQRLNSDAAWLADGLRTLQIKAGPATKLPDDLAVAYRRSLLCLPLLCGEEGAAVAAPEFDPEFISCGGYGYMWPRDGGEYVSGLIDAGYPEYATRFFAWCARHQDAAGLWHQRYFLNGEPGPNWCLPPHMLQIDQVGAVLWAYGKHAKMSPLTALPDGHADMIRRAADYLLSRLTSKCVHANAFDTWESFIGSFTYSNAAIHAALAAAAELLHEPRYADAARQVKEGVLLHFVQNDALVRGFDYRAEIDDTIDSASLGAIEPFGLLDLERDLDLRIAEATLRTISERLETNWEGGRAIRRFEGDAYVGGVPACVNTLWMARCSLKVAARLRALGRKVDADALTGKAQTYLLTVLRRTTPTGLLPELMQGPTGQRYWAAPHGWAMSSFVSGVLMLAEQLAER